MKTKSLFTHFVFCAGKHIPENQKAIQEAIDITKRLKQKWDEEACITGYYEGSIIDVLDDDHNIEIKFTNKNLSALIDHCMDFSRLKQERNPIKAEEKYITLQHLILLAKKENIDPSELRLILNDSNSDFTGYVEQAFINQDGNRKSFELYHA